MDDLDLAQRAPEHTDSAAERWLRPGVPRRRAAVLLLVAVSHLLCWLLLYHFLGFDRAPSARQDLGYWTSAVVPVVAAVTAAVLALTGSAVARLLGVVTVVSTTAFTVAPLVALGSYDSPLLSTTTLFVLPFVVLVALGAAAVVALALPGPAGRT